jgi:hypothetical protein
LRTGPSCRPTAEVAKMSAVDSLIVLSPEGFC